MMEEFNAAELEKRIGYTFHNKKMLKQAMCHSSYANEHRVEGLHDNERLEFLGDAVLEVASSDFLYHQYPDMPEGKLTRLRASIVCEPTLALCARELDLGSFLLLGKGEVHTGGRYRNSIISDAMEALIGAIYLDGGFANAKEFVQRFVLTDIEHKKLFYDSKTILQEIVQRDFKKKRSNMWSPARTAPIMQSILRWKYTSAVRRPAAVTEARKKRPNRKLHTGRSSD